MGCVPYQNQLLPYQHQILACLPVQNSFLLRQILVGNTCIECSAINNIYWDQSSWGVVEMNPGFLAKLVSMEEVEGAGDWY